MADRPAPPLLGRQVEMARIAALLDDIATGGGAIVLRGGPGIGKSRLLQEAAALATAGGLAVLSATGVQSEARLPFSGLHALLRPVRARVDQIAPALRTALDAAFGLGDGTPVEHFRIAMAVLDLLSDVATETPLLVAVDDAHWLDRASAEILAFVARRLESDPIVLLAATRDGYPVPVVDAGLPELQLGGLERGEATQLLDASAQKLGPAMRKRLLQQAEGNPLALLELPLAANASARESSARAGLPLTERLEQAFAARVSDLPEETRLLLLVTALVDGGNLDEVLEVAGSLTGTRVDAGAFEPAVQAALVHLDLQTVRFRHPLMCSAVRQSASVAQQRRVHDAVASSPDTDPDRRAWHRAALISGTHEEVARELEEAGQRARRRGSTGDALTALSRSAELSEGAQRPRRLLAAAQLAYEIGQPEAGAPLLREVTGLDLSPLDQARATWIGQMGSPLPLDIGGAAALTAAAERAEEAGDVELRIELLWMLCLLSWWGGTSDVVHSTLLRASHGLGGAEAADARIVAIYAYADAVGHTQAVLDRLRAVAAAGDYDTDSARYFGEAALVVGAFDLALPFFRDAVEGLRDDGRLGPLARTLSVYSFVAAFVADWDVALPAGEEARRLSAEFNQPIGVARAETVLSLIAGMRGDVDTAERLSAETERFGLLVRFGALSLFAQFGRIAAQLGAGRHGEAYASAERLFDPADPAHHSVVSSWFIADYAEAAAHVGRAEQATARVDALETAVGDDPAIWLAMGLRHARAVLADDGDAEQHFATALGADLHGWPFQRARLLLAQGQWLRRQRRVAESRAPLRAARDVFDAISCVAWSERARRELRASGESSRRRDPSTREQLTAQELQIAHLAAEGMSNRAIGERLYLSPRTISTHLYRIFPKLEITARGELRAALAQSALPRRHLQPVPDTT